MPSSSPNSARTRLLPEFDDAMAPSTNYLLRHSALRIGVMSDEGRAPTRAYDTWGRLIWPICQQGIARLICRFSADRSRCAALAKQTSELPNARASGGLLFAIGIASDAWQMKQAISHSIVARSFRPAAAQATRSLTLWGSVWAGAEVLGLGGALAGIETGPGVVITTGVGAIVGGFLGLFAGDWLVRKIVFRRLGAKHLRSESDDSMEMYGC
jgi:hypothetical protein